ncbi:family 16 glycoside hydrolase [Streptomyces sp. 4F14]|uniref:3-keto-disaccharide hydrolase n=1 Tax=Streptomyces sp. 4F14 TaxID=3394380 RepID=UPI003A8A2DF5
MRRPIASRLTAVAALTAATLAVPAFTAPASAHPVNPADFQQVEPVRGVGEVGEPMSLAVLPDRSVLHTARGGVLRRTTADGVTGVIGTLPPGEWNTFEALVTGERVQVLLNGAKVNDFTDTDPARSLTSGHIGVQNHGDGDDVSFRNIRIRELP